MKDIDFYDTDIDIIETQFEEYLEQNNIDCLDFEIDGRGFALIGADTSRAILYEKRVYYIDRGAVYYVNLHAIRIYKSYEDAMDNIDGDLSFYIYGLPNKSENLEEYEL